MTCILQYAVVCWVTTPGRTTALARSFTQEDRTVEEKAWWEPDQGAACTAASQEWLPGAEAAIQPWQMAQEEEPESAWGMLRQPMAGMHCLLTLVHSGTLPGKLRGLNSLQPR
jgi:hypothetical protein